MIEGKEALTLGIIWRWNTAVQSEKVVVKRTTANANRSTPELKQTAGIYVSEAAGRLGVSILEKTAVELDMTSTNHNTPT